MLKSMINRRLRTLERESKKLDHDELVSHVSVFYTFSFKLILSREMDIRTCLSL